MKQLLRIAAVSLSVFLLAACAGSDTSSDQQPAESADSAVQNDTETNADPDKETAQESPSVFIRFDSHVYRNTDDDDFLNALTYATNNSDKTVQITIRCQAFDADGNVISAYDQFKGRYIDTYTTDLFVPAGVKDLPVAFVLPTGFRYDISKDEYMPEIDHLDLEMIGSQETDLEDLRDHFTVGVPEIKENHIYINVRFDEDIADNYTAIYPDHTLLGYSGDTVTTVCCRNSFPYGTSSVSVSYAKEHNDSSMLVYHDVFQEPADRWELYLGCIGAK